MHNWAANMAKTTIQSIILTFLTKCFDTLTIKSMVMFGVTIVMFDVSMVMFSVTHGNIWYHSW